MESNSVVAISFIVYSLFIVAVGVYATGFRKKTDDDFVLANRELGPWASALSASASAESGWVMLGLVGLAFTSGLSAFWIAPGIGLGYLFNWFVIADRLRNESSDLRAATLPQYIMRKFGGSRFLIWLPAVIIAAAMLGYVAAQMNAAGKAFEATFNLPYSWGVLTGAAIVLAYTVTGGFRAICWTDIIQASFMVVALIGMPIVLLIDLGGYTAMADKVRLIDPQLMTLSGANSGFALLGFVVGMMGIGLGYPGQPHVLARFMAAKDKQTVRTGGAIAFAWFLLVYVGAIFFGLFARAYFGTLADAEQALPLACSELLHPVVAGFVIAAIVAAICSTADSQLIVVSTTFSRDILPLFRKQGKNAKSYEQTQRVDRWTLVILAIISVAFALTENRVIFSFVLYAWSALGASFGPLIILSLMWKRTSRAGAVAGMLTGAIVTIVWKNVAELSSVLYELVPAFALSFVAVWLFSLTMPDKK